METVPGMDIWHRPAPKPALLLNLSPITSKEARHLIKVYSTLIVGVFIAIAGFLAHERLNFGGFFTCLCALYSITRVFESRRKWKQKVFYVCFEFMKGASLGGVFMTSWQPVLHSIAAATVVAILMSFALASIFTQNRCVLYAIAIFGSLIIYSGLILVLDANYGSESLRDTTPFFLLLSLVIYLLISSQNTLERYRKRGNRTQYQHSADIYVDWFGFLVRICAVFIRDRRIRKQLARMARHNEDHEHNSACSSPTSANSMLTYTSESEMSSEERMAAERRTEEMLKEQKRLVAIMEEENRRKADRVKQEGTNS